MGESSCEILSSDGSEESEDSELSGMVTEDKAVSISLAGESLLVSERDGTLPFSGVWPPLTLLASPPRIGSPSCI